MIPTTRRMETDARQEAACKWNAAGRLTINNESMLVDFSVDVVCTNVAAMMRSPTIKPVLVANGNITCIESSDVVRRMFDSMSDHQGMVLLDPSLIFNTRFSVVSISHDPQIKCINCYFADGKLLDVHTPRGDNSYSCSIRFVIEDMDTNLMVVYGGNE